MVVIDWSQISAGSIMAFGGPQVNMISHKYDGFEGVPFTLLNVGERGYLYSKLTEAYYGYGEGYDHALLALHQDGGKTVLTVWGLTSNGTLAAAQVLEYFDTIYHGMLSNKALVIRWNDTNMNGRVDVEDNISVIEAWDTFS